MSSLTVVQGKTGVFPHRRFVKYLLSKKMTSFEITAVCTDRGLLCPTAEDLQTLSSELGDFPSSWQSSLRGAKHTFRNWLNRRELYEAWKRSPAFEEAETFLFKVSARKDFEALYLIRGDVSQAREELLVKYPAGFIPSVEALGLFVDYYWDLGALKYDEIIDYLQQHQDREDLMPAIGGDLTTTYARLGLRQKIEEEEFYDNLIALANQQIQVLRRTPDLNGSMLMGIAALSRQAADAIESRRELHASSAPSVDAIRQKAADFFRVKMASQPEIISIDDLREEQEQMHTLKVIKMGG